MNVYGVYILSDKSLLNVDILNYVSLLNIPNFHRVFPRDELPKNVKFTECDVMNFDTREEAGSHWVCYMKK